MVKVVIINPFLKKINFMVMHHTYVFQGIDVPINENMYLTNNFDYCKFITTNPNSFKSNNFIDF